MSETRLRCRLQLSTVECPLQRPGAPPLGYVKCSDVALRSRSGHAQGDDTMQARTILAGAALLAGGVLIGWLAASGRVAERLHAQDKAPAEAAPASPRYDELAGTPFPEKHPTKEDAAKPTAAQSLHPCH